VLEGSVVRTDADDGTCWRRHLVLTNLDVLRDCDCLAFVEHTEPVALFDPEVLDRVLRLVPGLDVGTLVHDQGAEVPRVEHDDVSRLRVGVEAHEGADEDAQATEVRIARDLEGGVAPDTQDVLVELSGVLGFIYRRYIKEYS
jgi:hypothetical protein